MLRSLGHGAAGGSGGSFALYSRVADGGRLRDVLGIPTVGLVPFEIGILGICL